MGNPNQHECSIENKPEKSGAPIPPHQVLAQLAPERGEQLKQITQLAASDSLTGLPGLAVEDKSKSIAAQLGRAGSQPDGFERFLASLAPSKSVSDATTLGATTLGAGIQDRAQTANPANAANIEPAAGIRIDVNQPLTRSGISLADVLSQAPATPAKDAVLQSEVRIPGRTDMESALNGLAMANQMRAASLQPSAAMLADRTACGTNSEQVTARSGETPVVIRATEEAGAVQAVQEQAVARSTAGSGEPSLPAAIVSEQIRSGSGEPLVIGAAAAPLIATASERGLVTSTGVQPVLARAAEAAMLARSTAEPVVAGATEVPVVAGATEVPMAARAAAEVPLVATATAETLLATAAAETVVATPAAETVVATPAAETVVATPAAETVVATAAPETVLATSAPEPVVATSAPEPVLATPAAEPVLATPAAEPVLATAAAEPVLATPAAEFPSAKGAEDPVTQKAVEATLSRMLEGASLRTAEDSLPGKQAEAAPKYVSEPQVKEGRRENDHNVSRALSDAPSVVPATARNIVIPDTLEPSNPHHHHHQTSNILGTSLTVGHDRGFEARHDHAASTGHYHWHGNGHGTGYHRPLRGSGSDEQVQHPTYAAKDDTLVVTARSMVFNPDSNKRYMTGAEIALGVVLVSGAIAKLKEHAEDKQDEDDEEEPTDAVRPQRKDPDSIHYFQKLTATGTTRAAWIVGVGDTLTSLGERFYEDARVGYLIAQINHGVTQQHNIDGKLVVQLFTRQSIYLPNREDLQQFYGRSLNDLKVENLVTIVTEREFDRQLVNMVMNRAMGITAETATAHLPVFAMAATGANATVAASNMIPTGSNMVAAGESPLTDRRRGQDQPAETNDDHHPLLPPPTGSGAISLAGFLSYLHSKYKPQADVAGMARARLSLRCKF